MHRPHPHPRRTHSRSSTTTTTTTKRPITIQILPDDNNTDNNDWDLCTSAFPDYW